MPVTASGRRDPRLLQVSDVERHAADVGRRHPVDERRRQLDLDRRGERQALAARRRPSRPQPTRMSARTSRSHRRASPSWPSGAPRSCRRRWPAAAAGSRTRRSGWRSSRGCAIGRGRAAPTVPVRCPVAAATLSRSSLRSDFDARLRVAAVRASGCRYGAAPARSVGREDPGCGGCRRFRRRPARRATRAARRDRSPAAASPAGASAAPRSTITGPSSVTTMLRRAQAPGGRARPACSVCASRHTASSSSACISSGARVSSCRPPTSSMARTIDPSGSDMRARSSGQCTPLPPGEEQEKSFVLDARVRATPLASRRRDRAGAACDSRGRAGRRRGCPARRP